MKVKCVKVGGDALVGADLASGNTRATVFHVTADREYTAYGLLFARGVISYLIHADTGLPQWTPGSLFRVICGRPSRHWILACRPSLDGYFAAMCFPELLETWDLFDQLSLGCDGARAIFFKRKELADLELSDPSVETVARPLESDWLQCPFCSDAWQSNSLVATVTCPKCGRTSYNPRSLGGRYAPIPSK